MSNVDFTSVCMVIMSLSMSFLILTSAFFLIKVCNSL